MKFYDYDPGHKPCFCDCGVINCITLSENNFPRNDITIKLFCIWYVTQPSIRHFAIGLKMGSWFKIRFQNIFFWKFQVYSEKNRLTMFWTFFLQENWQTWNDGSIYIENYPCCGFLCNRHVIKGAFAQKGAAGIIFDIASKNDFFQFWSITTAQF